MKLPFDAHPDGVRVRVGDDHLLALEMIPDLLDSVGAAEGDPALRRLSPTAYLDDPAAQEEYGRLTQPELERERTADRRVLNQLLAARKQAEEGEPKTPGAKVLGEEEVAALLRVMNESRLTLAARLGIEDDAWEEAPDRPDQESPAMMLLRYLTFLQEALIETLAGPSPSPG